MQSEATNCIGSAKTTAATRHEEPRQSRKAALTTSKELNGQVSDARRPLDKRDWKVGTRVTQNGLSHNTLHAEPQQAPPPAKQTGVGRKTDSPGKSTAALTRCVANNKQ